MRDETNRENVPVQEWSPSRAGCREPTSGARLSPPECAPPLARSRPPPSRTSRSSAPPTAATPASSWTRRGSHPATPSHTHTHAQHAPHIQYWEWWSAETRARVWGVTRVREWMRLKCIWEPARGALFSGFLTAPTCSSRFEHALFAIYRLNNVQFKFKIK